MTTPTRLRSDIRALTTLAERDLDALWKLVNSFAAADRALNDVLPTLIEVYGQSAAAIASDWYDEARLKAGVGGSFRAFPMELPDPGVAKLTGWALSEGRSLETARSLVRGGIQKRIANAARGTVMRSSVSDPKAAGWMRVGAGACSFCRMLIGRGAVYTEATVNFGSHDHCNCQAAPKFPGAEPVNVEKYRESLRKRDKDADNERAAKWIESNLPAGPAIPTF